MFSLNSTSFRTPDSVRTESGLASNHVGDEVGVEGRNVFRLDQALHPLWNRVLYVMCAPAFYFLGMDTFSSCRGPGTV